MQSRDGGCLLCKKKNWLINSIWPIGSREGVAVICAPRRRYVCLDIPAPLASCLVLHITGPAQVSWSKEFWEWGQGQGVSDTWYFFISCNESLTHLRAAWRFSVFPAASLGLWVLARKVPWPGRASPGPGLVSGPLRIWVLHLKHWGPHWLLLSSDPSREKADWIPSFSLPTSSAETHPKTIQGSQLPPTISRAPTSPPRAPPAAWQPPWTPPHQGPPQPPPLAIPPSPQSRPREAWSLVMHSGRTWALFCQSPLLSLFKLSLGDR